MENNLSTINVLYDSVLAKPSENNNKTSSGLYVPESANSDNIIRAEVVKVGDGRLTQAGSLFPNKISVGDVVFYLKRDSVPVKVEDTEYHVVKENVILMYQRSN